MLGRIRARVTRCWVMRTRVLLCVCVIYASVAEITVKIFMPFYCQRLHGYFYMRICGACVMLRSVANKCCATIVCCCWQRNDSVDIVVVWVCHTSQEWCSFVNFHVHLYIAARFYTKSHLNRRNVYASYNTYIYFYIIYIVSGLHV